MECRLEFGLIYRWIFLLNALPIPSIFAHVDLFIPKEEMKRLMGVEGELWYVEDGITNQAAADYELELLSTVNDLYFSWSNKGTDPVPYWINIRCEPDLCSTAPAILSIPSNGNILPSDSPSVNGRKPDTFSVRIPRCEFLNSPEIYIRIRFEFDPADTSNLTVLDLHRRKRCPSKSMTVASFQDSYDYDDSDELNSEEKFSQKRSLFPGTDFFGSATNIFYVGMGCLFGFMIIFSCMIILYFTKANEGASCCKAEEKERTRRQNGDEIVASLLSHPPRKPIMSSTPMDAQTAVAIRRVCANGGGSITSSANEKQIRHSASPSILSRCASAAGAASFSSAANGCAFQQQSNARDSMDHSACVFQFPDKELKIENILKELMVEKSDIELGRSVLEGTFGEVFIGRLNRTGGNAAMRRKGGENNGSEQRDDVGMEIIVKSLKEKASIQQIDRFLHESLRFTELPAHPNVCLPLATSSTDDVESDAEGDHQQAAHIRYLICFPHIGYGNLKKFLLRGQGPDATGGAGLPPVILSTQDLVYAALQIIRGLLHLHKFQILHRDVATRNCLVSHDLTIQICDTGLSRDIFPLDYHCLGDNENRPIRWMAYESLENAEFSTASDVWSFGVTLWELTTLAQQPYAEVDPFEMQAYLSADQRLSQPYNCPDELYLLMYCCWNLHPKARPTFSQLLAAMEHFYAQLTQYI